MTVTIINRRKDGKYLVNLHFEHGTNLRKIVTADQLPELKLKATNRE